MAGCCWAGLSSASCTTRSNWRAAADSADFPFVAMHYVNAGATPEQQLENILNVVSPATALVLDVESGSGTVDDVTALYNLLIKAGYHIPFVYLPEWYWKEGMGSPDLSHLPPLWASRYVSGSGRPQDLLGQVPISWWAGYGNSNPILLQYTNSGVVPNQTLGDFSLFNGDAAQFRRFLDSANFTYPPEDDTMITGTLAASLAGTRHTITIPVGRQVEVTMSCDGTASFTNIFAWIAPAGGNGWSSGAVKMSDQGAYSFRPPKGTAKLDVQYKADSEIDYVVDVVG